MQQHLVRTFEPGDQRLDRAAMIAVGGVDDGVRCLCLRDEQRTVIETADHRLDTRLRQLVDLFRAAYQPGHPDAHGEPGTPRSIHR